MNLEETPTSDRNKLNEESLNDFEFYVKFKEKDIAQKSPICHNQGYEKTTLDKEKHYCRSVDFESSSSLKKIK